MYMETPYVYGRNVLWLRQSLFLVSYGEYADRTDRRTSDRTLHYAVPYGRNQHNDFQMSEMLHLGQN